MRRFASGLTALAVAVSLASCAPPAAPKAGADTGPDKEYLVFYADGRARAVLAAVEHAGGHIVTTDTKLGYVLAKGGGDAFVDALGSDRSVVGVTTDREIGFATTFAGSAPSAAGVGALASGVRGSLVPRAFPDASAMRGVAGEPLAGRQWDMKMIGADRANKKAPGTKKVLVGVIDTGIDGNHP
ncbi:MAG TPA: peptidase S8 and S53 subtilisin kexin sedolisin, partial [Nonomuraea sp.]|nr:peptidase S8 and S53 subtilisin kexin sedolisin [Nonomuraea sp.]